MQRDPNASPFLEIPPVVLGLAVVIAGVELLFVAAEAGLLGGAAGVGLRAGAAEGYGFAPRLWSWMLENRVFEAQHLARFVTYPFLHLSLTHALMACVFILAMGKAASQLFAQWKVLVLFFGGSFVGALAYGSLGNPVFLIGAYPGAYALIGAFTFQLWLKAKAVGEAPRRAFGLIGMLAAIQIGFGLVLGGAPHWVADLCGFATGFALCFLLVPGGLPALRKWLRNR